jgi:hypothetical protein
MSIPDELLLGQGKQLFDDIINGSVLFNGCGMIGLLEQTFLVDVTDLLNEFLVFINKLTGDTVLGNSSPIKRTHLGEMFLKVTFLQVLIGFVARRVGLKVQTLRFTDVKGNGRMHPADTLKLFNEFFQGLNLCDFFREMSLRPASRAVSLALPLFERRLVR